MRIFTAFFLVSILILGCDKQSDASLAAQDSNVAEEIGPSTDIPIDNDVDATPGFSSDVVVYLAPFVNDGTSGVGAVQPSVTLTGLSVSTKQQDSWAEEVSRSLKLLRSTDSSVVESEVKILEEFRDETRDLKLTLDVQTDLQDDEWYEISFATPDSAAPFLLNKPSYRVIDGEWRVRFKIGHDAVIRSIDFATDGGPMTIRFSETLYSTSTGDAPDFSVSQTDNPDGGCSSRVPASAWVNNGSSYINADCQSIYPSESIQIVMEGILINENGDQLQDKDGKFELMINPEQWISCEREGMNNPTCLVYIPEAL